MKKLVPALVATLALGTLAACGGDSEADAFCGTKDTVNALFTGGDASAESLAEIKVPAEIQDAWDTLLKSRENSTTSTPEQDKAAQQAAQQVSEYVTEHCG